MQNKSLKKACIVAGNGPSLKEIDYSLMPLDYDVFRCNQFYFEDKYYLGKNVSFAFLNPSIMFQQYYTFYNLHKKNEYIIYDIVVSGVSYYDIVNVDKDFFLYMINGINLYKKLKYFVNFVNFHRIYNFCSMTSGVYMCAVAIALGYKEIYLCGIDFYDKSKDFYAFNTEKTNLLNFDKNFSKHHYKDSSHNKQYDIECLIFLQDNYNCKIYSLCPNSPLSEYISLAPKTNNTFIIKDKPNGYIDDLMIPIDRVYNKTINTKHNRLKSNFYYKAFKDLFRLPSDIRYYLKNKLQN